MIFQNVFGGNVITNQTQLADTVINTVVPPSLLGRTRVSRYSYKAGGTAHSLYALRPLSRTILSSAAAASQAVINLAVDPGSLISPTNLIATNDILAIRNDNGTVFTAKVSSVSGLAITLTASLSTALLQGNTVWFYGIITDTDPKTGLAHPKWNALLAASTTTNLTGDGYFLVNSHQEDEPIILQSDNPTAAGTMLETHYKYTPANA